jgi:hypothetical protein
MHRYMLGSVILDYHLEYFLYEFVDGVQAGMTAIGTGLAWARQQRDSHGICRNFIGDCTLGNDFPG